MAQLIVQIDGKPPEIHELTDKAVTIGRETDNAVVIADSSVSRHHAEILAGDGPRTLRDLNSANGTTVNDVPVTEKMLKLGDIIHFGFARVSFAATPSAAVKAPPSAAPVKLPAPLTPPRRQEPPPAAAVPPPAAPAPVVLRVAPVPAVELPPETVPPEKTPSPGAPLKVPVPVPVGRPPAVAGKALSPSEPSSAVKAVPPSKVETAPRVKEMPPPPAVPPVQIPAAGKATPPAAAPPERARRPDLPLSPEVPKPLPPAPVVHKTPAPPPVVPPTKTVKPTPAEGKVLPPAESKTPPPLESKVSPPSIESKALQPSENKAQPTTRPALPVAVPPTPRPPAVVRPPVGKSLPSELPPVGKKRPAREVAKPAQPALLPSSDLPLVPDNIGRENPTPAIIKQASPPPVETGNETSTSESAPRHFSRRLLASAAILILLAAGTTGVWALRRPAQPAARPVPVPSAVTAAEAKGKATKKLWEQLQTTAQAGLQQAQSISLQEYPVLSNGIYDFALIDDLKLDSLMTTLTSRARALSRVSQEFALLDKTNVDADVAAFSKKVGAHWERAAGLDFDAVNLAWAVHSRRMRPVDPGAPALGSADVVAGENRPVGKTAETMDNVNKLANDWLVERVRFAEASNQIDAEEKEMLKQITARY